LTSLRLLSEPGADADRAVEFIQYFKHLAPEIGLRRMRLQPLADFMPRGGRAAAGSACASSAVIMVQRSNGLICTPGTPDWPANMLFMRASAAGVVAIKRKLR
jgi:hypothetical protein